jgi:hypothetical protein
MSANNFIFVLQPLCEMFSFPDMKMVVESEHFFISLNFSLFFFISLSYADVLKIFFPVAGNSDFANAQAELVFFVPDRHRQIDAAQLGEV